jgi:hypothetical protein
MGWLFTQPRHFIVLFNAAITEAKSPVLLLVSAGFVYQCQPPRLLTLILAEPVNLVHERVASPK